jgi:hypothetical protein
VHPRSPRHAVVCLLASVSARRRTAGSLRAVGAPPAAAERILPGGSWSLPRTRLIPASAHPACGARRRSAIRAIGARRNPAPVRQPVLAARHRPAVQRSPVQRSPVQRSRVRRPSVHGARVRRASVQRSRVHRAAVAGRAVGRVAVGRVSRWWWEASRRAHARAARLTKARLRRHFPGAPQQLSVLVVVGTVRPVRAPAVIGAVGAAIAQASSPGQAIGIAAQAGVATFHQVPPGPWLSSRAGGHALPHECRSGEIPCTTETVNCHQLHIIGRY